DAIFHETDHAVLGILVKFSWHIPDFPIYSNGTKPGTLHSSLARIFTTLKLRSTTDRILRLIRNHTIRQSSPTLH
ncbi:hypothetical protein, partial [Corynebacterium coyleae]|uniref:hypothetical protein n=1 Tax=Corynebacterium coyleae TaxID=53374 RepID=UPI001C60F114